MAAAPLQPTRASSRGPAPCRGIEPVRIGCVYVPLVILVLLAGGFVYLMTNEIPAPSTVIEKDLPDDRFPR